MGKVSPPPPHLPALADGQQSESVDYPVPRGSQRKAKLMARRLLKWSAADLTPRAGCRLFILLARLEPKKTIAAESEAIKTLTFSLL